MSKIGASHHGISGAACAVVLLAVLVGGVGLLFVRSESSSGTGAEDGHGEPAAVCLVGFEESHTDLGAHPWNVLVHFDLPFLNRSAQPLRIADIATSCGCTLIEKEQYVGGVVNPGETLSISGELDTELEAGDQLRSVTLRTSDGSEYVAFLNVQVIVPYKFEPRIVDFGTVVVGDRRGAEAAPQPRSVRFVSDTVHLVGEPETDSHWLSAAYRTDGDGQAHVRIGIRREALASGGKTFGRITVTTDDAYVPQWTIPVTAAVVHDLACAPGHVFLREGRPQAVHVTNQRGDPVSISSWKSADPSVQLRVLQSGMVEISCEPSEAKESITVQLIDTEGRTVDLLVTNLSMER